MAQVSKTGFRRRGRKPKGNAAAAGSKGHNPIGRAKGKYDEQVLFLRELYAWVGIPTMFTCTEFNV